jgi:hypothetical protein
MGFNSGLKGLIETINNSLNAELNPICHLLALLGAHLIFHVNRIRVNKLLVFERKILRKIFGSNNENGTWRIKTNQELDEIIKHKNIINFIRAQRLSWFGHIERMQGTRMVKAIYSWKPISRRPIGRPKTRWVDDVIKDTQKLKVPNWKTLAQDRRRWKELVVRAQNSIKEL